MKYLLDTHVWLWAVNRDPELSVKVQTLLAETDPGDLALADISLLEVARKAAVGQVTIAGDILGWLRTNSRPIQVLPITPEIAWRSAQLDWAWKDPADRLIVATALEHGLTLITKDRQIARWGGVQMLW